MADKFPKSTTQKLVEKLHQLKFDPPDTTFFRLVVAMNAFRKDVEIVQLQADRSLQKMHRKEPECEDSDEAVMARKLQLSKRIACASQRDLHRAATSLQSLLNARNDHIANCSDAKRILAVQAAFCLNSWITEGTSLAAIRGSGVVTVDHGKIHTWKMRLFEMEDNFLMIEEEVLSQMILLNDGGDWIEATTLDGRYFQKLWIAAPGSSGFSFTVDVHDAVDQVL